jgi:HK97 family phage prohead protease
MPKQLDFAALRGDEIRGQHFEIREAQAVGRPYKYLEGRAVPYDTWADIGFFLESHDPSSFLRSTKTGAKHAPLLLFHDNQSFPIGQAEKWSHDGGALDGVWKLNDSTEAQRAARAADDGELVGMSVGFSPIRSAWDFVDEFSPELGPEYKDRVTRLESRLVEVSLTPTPAFEDAGVVCVRTAWTLEQRAKAYRAQRGPRRVEAWRADLERLR